MINPEDFIITRKRKKYKFAMFANSPLCFESTQWNLQGSTSQITTLEVGAGTGQFLVEMAVRHPDRQFVAVDVKADRLQKGAYEAAALGLLNIRFLRARADQLVKLFPPHSVEEIWLTFSDPFPKARSAGRRMTHATFLRQYRQLLSSGGSLLTKHDDRDFFHWTLEQLVTDGWRIDELSFDLHNSDLSGDYKILTAYEQRWLNEGSKINFVSCRSDSE